MLQIEQKFLESTESLLVADHQSQAKNEKRAKAISTHRSNVSLLQAAIAEAKGESANEQDVSPYGSMSIRE